MGIIFLHFYSFQRNNIFFFRNNIVPVIISFQKSCNISFPSKITGSRHMALGMPHRALPCGVQSLHPKQQFRMLLPKQKPWMHGKSSTRARVEARPQHM